MMWRRATVGAALILLPCAGAAIVAPAWRPDRPPLAHTGGFGEPTCHACHMGDAPDTADHALRIDGLPARYVAGRRYTIVVTLQRTGLERGGFEAAIRLASGRQAGRLVSSDTARMTVEPDTTTGVLYAHHTRKGTEVEAGTARWSVFWEAPRAGGDVVLHAAAVASNDDNSNLGDVVYAASVSSRPR